MIHDQDLKRIKIWVLDCTCKELKEEPEVREVIDIQLRIVENKRLGMRSFSTAQHCVKELLRGLSAVIAAEDGVTAR